MPVARSNRQSTHPYSGREILPTLTAAVGTGMPAPTRALVAASARSAEVGGLNTILLIVAVSSFAAAVASLLLVCERDFVETGDGAVEEPAELAAAA
jgi:hypothetical protein